MHGLDFGPYAGSQDPNVDPRIGADALKARLALIAGRARWIRSFGATDGLELLPALARDAGFQLAMGASLNRDGANNERQLANVVATGRAGTAAVLVVGSEVLLRGDLAEAALVDCLRRARAAAPGVPVTYADTWSTWLAHPALVAEVDIVYANVHPYWEGVSIDDALAAVHMRCQQLKAAAAGRPVVVSESGWPSVGNSVGGAVPNAANAARFALELASWARQQQVDVFFFEAFDEPWKAKYEGPQGAHWGLFDEQGVIKPGLQDVFAGRTAPDTWSDRGIPGGAGTPSLAFTSVPPRGSFADLRGQALHVTPFDHQVAVVIRVGAGWWTKPYASQPLTPLAPDGSWVADITTGGIDESAVEIAAFLLPAGVSPPLLLGDAVLPAALTQAALASARVLR